MTDTTQQTVPTASQAGFGLRVGAGLAGLALLTVGVAFGAHWAGRMLAEGGHTDEVTPYRVVIGKDAVTAPANTIRSERARHDGMAARLDLYLRWPEMEGYSAQARDAFNGVGASRDILFLTFETRLMSRDMSGRFEPIYSLLVRQPGRPGPDGSILYGFKENSGYASEELVVAARPDDTPFVARCLIGSAAADSLAPCERDVFVGSELSLTYRFPRDLLKDWRALDTAVIEKADAMLSETRQDARAPRS